MNDETLFEKVTNHYTDDHIGMYYCGKRIGTKNHKYGPEIRNHYLFVLVNRGEATLYGKKKIKFGTHDMLVMCPGEKIYYEADTPWSIQWVGLYGNGIEKYVKKLGIGTENPILKIPFYRELESILDKLYSLSDDTSLSAKLKKTGFIYQFFSTLFECSDYKTGEDIVLTAVKIIDYNLANALSVEKLAQTLHLNASYFTRIFTKRLGISPKQYITVKRLERAKELLRETNASVYEISNSAGFSDQLYFSRVFKKYEKSTPTQYRIESRHCRDTSED